MSRGDVCGGCWIGCSYDETRLGIDVGAIMSELHLEDRQKARPGESVSGRSAGLALGSEEVPRGQRGSWKPSERIPGVSRGPALFEASKRKAQAWELFKGCCDRNRALRSELSPVRRKQIAAIWSRAKAIKSLDARRVLRSAALRSAVSAEIERRKRVRDEHEQSTFWF